MNTKKDIVQVILDNDIELSDEQITKINGIKEYIRDSENYIKTASNADKNWISSATIVQTTDEIKRNIRQAEEEMVNIAFDGYTTWYKQHNSDIANMAMYKLASWLEIDDYKVSNSTYGNDCCASIRVDFPCFERSIQIFIPNSTKDDMDNEEYADYYVDPKDHHDESIDGQGRFFDINDIHGIRKYCEALYKLYEAEHDLEALQA